MDLRHIEEAGLNNLHTRRQLLYDGWLLFLLPGKAKRARSVNPHFGSTLPLSEKIAHCERVYAQNSLPALFRITPFAQPETIDRELASRGYVEFDRTLVQVAPLAAPPDGVTNHDLVLEHPLLDTFVDAIGELRGSTPAQRAAHLERLAQSPLDLRAVIARVDGVAVAAGLVSIDGALAGVFDIGTAPAARGQGIGTAVVAALLTRAWERGARQAFLQVTEDNAPAIAIYRRFGFETAYTYHYRALPEHSE
jgi:ribosomal protein S18 acetylase RimI-like enzyme